MKNKGPKVLIIDIETTPILAHVWSIWEQNVGLNQIEQDWKIMSFAAKWLDNKNVIQVDMEKHSERRLLNHLHQLMDEADIVIGQNSKQFDVKKIYARFVHHDMKPPSSFQQIDTKLLAKKHFNFTSNSLEYLSDKLCKKYKKLKHKKFPGMELWTECLKGNKKAWKAMREYNIFDVLTTEELYKKLAPYDKGGVNYSLYNPQSNDTCSCGSTDFYKNGYVYLSTGKYQRYQCKKCGAEKRHWKNEAKKVLR